MSDLLNSASLVMIPSGYKEDTVYSVVPSDGSGDLSFTRASNGTRINSAGLVEVCPWNYFEYSNTFTNWANSGGSITLTTGQNDPSGGTNAALFARTLAYDYLLSYVPNDKYTVYCTVKKATSNFFRIAATSFGDATFNINTGTVIASDGGTASIISLGNGWYQCIIAFNSLNGGFYLQNFPVANADNGSGSVYIYQAQANIGSTAKPYFPTTDRLNVPRLTYQNGGGGCPSLLLEKQSTNLVTYSEQIQNAAWNVIGGDLVVTGNAVISPDGTQNAGAITLANSANRYFVHDPFSITGGVAYTYSVWMKSASGNLSINMGGVNGLVGVLKTVTTEWQRFTYTFTPATTYDEYFGFDNRGAGSSTSGTLYFWGAQVEASSYPTSYIPSTSSSATRVADACFKTGVSSLIGQTSGVLFVDFIAKGSYDSNNLLMLISTGSAGEIIYLNLVSGTIEAYIAASSTQQFLYNGGTVLTANTRHKLAIGYANNDIVLYHNGTQLATDTSATIPACSVLRVGDFLGGTLQFGNTINQSILFPSRLSNSELASLTSL